MRNVKFWCFMSLVVMAVFLFSGCGGSLDGTNEENAEEATSNTPSNQVVVYDAEKILPGTWQPYELVTTKINSLDVELANASVVISNVVISKDSGTSEVTSRQTWYSFAKNENIPVTLEESNMNMIRTTDINKWHCTSGTGKFAKITLKISSDSIITINYIDHTSSSVAIAPFSLVSVDINLRKTQ